MAALHSWYEKQILLAFPCPITPWLHVLVDMQGTCGHEKAREGNPVGNWHSTMLYPEGMKVRVVIQTKQSTLVPRSTAAVSQVCPTQGSEGGVEC